MITYRMLKNKGACENQVNLFKKLFPNGAPLTVETALSVAGEFDFEWAASKLLSEGGKAAYKEANAPLWAAYEEAKASLWAAYKEANAPLWAAYLGAKASLWAAYLEAKASLWAAYLEARAKLFAELYIKENTK